MSHSYTDISADETMGVRDSSIILENKKAFLVDKENMIKYADKNNLFIFGI